MQTFNQAIQNKAKSVADTVVGKQETILSEAEKTIFQRQGTYDKPENNFQRIADFWNAYIRARPSGGELTPKDVALMMVLLKIAREVYQHKRDNLVDGAGYLQCADLIDKISDYGEKSNMDKEDG